MKAQDADDVAEKLKTAHLSDEDMQKLHGITPSPQLFLSGTLPGTGHVNNLTSEQQLKLYQLWGLLVEFLTRPFEESTAKRNKALAQTLMTAGSNASTGSIASTSSSRSGLMGENPLTTEFWSQLSFEDPDVTVLRFLRARKWSVPDAFAMMVECLKWRRSFGVRALMQSGDSAVKRELLEAGKTFFWNVDRENRLVIVITAKLHDKNAQTLQETMDFTVYCMELGRQLMQPGIETVTMIFDLTDATISSMDLKSMQFMAQCFQAFYPECLGRCLVLNAPWLFWGFWKMVKPLLDPVVVAKIEFVKPADLKTYIDPGRLMKRFGGLSDYEYRYIPPTPSDNPQPLGVEEADQVLQEMESLKIRFIDTTLEVNAVVGQLSDSFVGDAKKMLMAQLMERRDSLKKRLGALVEILEARRMPRSLYHRIGVLSDDGPVKWPAVSPVQS